MKTFFLLTEGVQIAMVSALSAIILALIGLFPLVIKFIRQFKALHTQMDGMKDELVRTTAELNRIKGIREGRDEMKQELKDENTTNIEKPTTSVEPTPVVIINPEPLPVIVKKPSENK